MITTRKELWKYRSALKSIFNRVLPIEVAAKFAPHQHIFWALVEYQQRRDELQAELGVKKAPAKGQDPVRHKAQLKRFNDAVAEMADEEVEFTAKPLKLKDVKGAGFNIIEVALMQDFGILHAG